MPKANNDAAGGKEEKAAGGKGGKEEKAAQGKGTPAADSAKTETEGKKGKKGKKEKKEKKPHPVINTFFLTTLLWIFIIMSAAILAFFNVFTLKEIILQALNPEEDFEVVFKSDIETLHDWETDLEAYSAELDDRALELDDREYLLDEREYELDEREYMLAEKYPDSDEENAQPGETFYDIYNVAKGIAAMDTAQAARMLVETDIESATQLLMVMKPAQRGAILSEMSAEDAAMFADRMTASP